MLRVANIANLDPYDTHAAPAVIASGVRAVIGRPRGDEAVAGGSQEVVDLVLTCDPTDLVHTDQVRDELTEEVYGVAWVQQRNGLGLDLSNIHISYPTIT